MNLRLIVRLLARFALFFSLTLVVPLVVALFETTDDPTVEAFGGAVASGLALSLLLWLVGSRSGGFFRKEGLAMVGIAWFLAGAIGAAPFVWAGAIPNPCQAYFESISGLTTTGATVLGPGNRAIDSLPPSILLWRSMLQWMGGIGIVLVFIALLPSMGITGSRLVSSEQVGMSDEAARPRMGEQARRLFRLYATLTAACAFCYWVAGLGAFDAVCHAFTTLATGGFSTHNVSVGGFLDLRVEIVAIVFMFLAGCNFVLMLRVFSRRRTGSATLYYSEFRTYLGITLAVGLIITLTLWIWGEPLRDDSLGIVHDYRNLGRCLRDAFFQTVSILTTTGYANADFQQWPKPALFLLMLCMVIGGCTGSTAGGYKVLRTRIGAHLAGFSLRAFIRPRVVEKLKVAREVISNRVVSAVLGLLLLWLFSIGVGAMVLVIDPRLDLVSAITASASMMGCVGPAFGEVVPFADGSFAVSGSVDLGPYAGYGLLHPTTHLVMSLQMVLGRLEILAPLALLTPRFWQR